MIKDKLSPPEGGLCTITTSTYHKSFSKTSQRDYSHKVEQWFSSTGILLPRSRKCGDIWRHFWLSQLELYWHLEGRCQGCCETSNNVYYSYYNSLKAPPYLDDLISYYHLASAIFAVHKIYTAFTCIITFTLIVPSTCNFPTLRDTNIAGFFISFRFLLKCPYLKWQCPFHHSTVYSFSVLCFSTVVFHFKCSIFIIWLNRSHSINRT